MAVWLTDGKRWEVSYWSPGGDAGFLLAAWSPGGGCGRFLSVKTDAFGMLLCVSWTSSGSRGASILRGCGGDGRRESYLGGNRLDQPLGGRCGVASPPGAAVYLPYLQVGSGVSFKCVIICYFRWRFTCGVQMLFKKCFCPRG